MCIFMLTAHEIVRETNEEIQMTKLLTLAETAERLRKTQDALRYMVQKGKAPKCAKIGGRLMFRESDVEAFIEAQFEQAATA